MVRAQALGHEGGYLDFYREMALFLTPRRTLAQSYERRLHSAGSRLVQPYECTLLELSLGPGKLLANCPQDILSNPWLLQDGIFRAQLPTDRPSRLAH
jgi:hypothetical protein